MEGWATVLHFEVQTTRWWPVRADSRSWKGQSNNSGTIWDAVEEAIWVYHHRVMESGVKTTFLIILCVLCNHIPTAQTPQRGPRFLPIKPSCILYALYVYEDSSTQEEAKRSEERWRTGDLPDQKWVHKPILVPFLLDNGEKVKSLNFSVIC